MLNLMRLQNLPAAHGKADFQSRDQLGIERCDAFAETRGNIPTISG